MELKNSIKKILDKNKINPKIVVDLGCGIMPYSNLFPDSKIIGVDINKNIKLNFKLRKNPNLSFRFQNLNISQEVPKSDLVIASLILHFIKEEYRKKLFEEISKSDYLLVAHLDKKVEIPSNFDLIYEGLLETEKETHDNLPEHSHKIFIELYKTNQTTNLKN